MGAVRLSGFGLIVEVVSLRRQMRWSKGSFIAMGAKRQCLRQHKFMLANIWALQKNLTYYKEALYASKKN
jgi:hypothetical protein